MNDFLKLLQYSCRLLFHKKATFSEEHFALNPQMNFKSSLAVVMQIVLRQWYFTICGAVLCILLPLVLKEFVSGTSSVFSAGNSAVAATALAAVLFLYEVMAMAERWLQNRVGIDLLKQSRDLLFRYFFSRSRLTRFSHSKEFTESFGLFVLNQKAQQISQLYLVREFALGSISLFFAVLTILTVQQELGFLLILAIAFLQVVSSLLARNYTKFKNESMILNSRDHKFFSNFVENAELYEVENLGEGLKKAVQCSEDKKTVIRRKLFFLSGLSVLLGDLVPFAALFFYFKFAPSAEQRVDLIAFSIAVIPVIKSNLSKVNSSLAPMLSAYAVLRDVIQDATQVVTQGSSAQESAKKFPDFSEKTSSVCRIFSGTLKENISLDSNPNGSLVVRAVATFELDIDFSDENRILSAKSVSGGQAARIGLARLVYAGVKPARELADALLASVSSDMQQRLLFNWRKEFPSCFPFESDHLVFDRGNKTEDVSPMVQVASTTQDDIMPSARKSGIRTLIREVFRNWKSFVAIAGILFTSLIAERIYTSLWQSLSKFEHLASESLDFRYVLLSLLFLLGLTRVLLTSFGTSEFLKSFVHYLVTGIMRQSEWNTNLRKHVTERMTLGLQNIEQSLIQNLNTLLFVSARTSGIAAVAIHSIPLLMVPFICFPVTYILLRKKLARCQHEAHKKFLSCSSGFMETLRDAESLSYFYSNSKCSILQERLFDATEAFAMRQVEKQSSAFVAGVCLRSLTLLLMIFFIALVSFEQAHAAGWHSTAIAIGLLLNLSDHFSQFERARREVQQAFTGFSRFLDFDQTSRAILAQNVCSGSLKPSRFTIRRVRLLQSKTLFLDFEASLELQRGKLSVLRGRSGKGKSTFLRYLCGLTESFDDQPRPNLEAHLSGQNPLVVPGDLRTNLDPDSNLCSGDLLEVLFRYPLFKKYETDRTVLEGNVENLSFQEKKIVSLERALHSKKELICLDEPTSSLSFEDANVAASRILQALENRFVVLVTHDALNRFPGVPCSAESDVIFQRHCQKFQT